MWPDWDDNDKSLLLMGIRTVWVARMEFQTATINMGPPEFGMIYLQRWPCAGAI